MEQKEKKLHNKKLAATRIGQKWNKLTLIAVTDERDCGHTVAWFMCDCGNPIPIKARLTAVRDGNTKTCGCGKKKK